MTTNADLLAQGWQQQRAGQLPEAERLARQIVDAEPGNVDARRLLGICLNGLARYAEAAEQFQVALNLQPSAGLHTNLAIALAQLGRLDEAIAQFAAAARLLPGDSRAHYNLATALLNRGRIDEAIAAFQQTLQLQANVADIHNNLGNALRLAGHLDEAIGHFRQALRLHPYYAEAHYNLGLALVDQDQPDQAKVEFLQCLRLKPDFAAAHQQLALLAQNRGGTHEAIQRVRTALRLQPKSAAAHCAQGIIHLTESGFAEAERCFRQSIQHEPEYANAWFQLATLLRARLPDDDIASMRRLLANPYLTETRRSELHFGLGTVLDARKSYAEAADHFQQANALAVAVAHKRGMIYNPAVHAEFVERAVAAYTPEFFECVRGWGNASERPVFVFGLPRSGTTLIEQVLASHSQVFGAGETFLGWANFTQLAGEHFDEAAAFAALADLDAATIQRKANRHLERLEALNATAPRVVDKMPENYLCLGLLATMFPKAKFIHCRRDLRDVALSCWTTHFQNVRWSNDPEHIASRFHAYRRLMDLWQRVLPVPVLEINYEETVADLEAVSRRLVQWCGLEWEPACLNFHEGKSPVRTASVVDVRRPLYASSVGRWRNYADSLAALFARLPS